MAPESNEAMNQATVSRTRRWWRVLELGTLALGLLCLGAYGTGMLHRYLGASLALSRFDAATAPEPPPAARGESVDFSLWSEKRIKGYWNSLAMLKDDPMAVLTIPRLQLRAPVFPGTDELVLNRGLGWIPGTSKPGENGNAGISGHRDGFFRGLKDVKVGDPVELATPQARLVYRVDEIEIVLPADVGVLRPRGTASVTLVTCFPFYYAGGPRPASRKNRSGSPMIRLCSELCSWFQALTLVPAQIPDSTSEFWPESDFIIKINESPRQAAFRAEPLGRRIEGVAARTFGHVEGRTEV